MRNDIRINLSSLCFRTGYSGCVFHKKALWDVAVFKEIEGVIPFVAFHVPQG